MGEIKDLLKQGASQQKLEAFLGPFQLKANPSVLNNLVSLQKHLAPYCDSEAFLHRVLRAIRETADPEQALNQLERFFLSLDDPASVLPLLAEGRHTLNTLSIIFGASPYLANILIQNPGLLSWLIQDRVWKDPVEHDALLEEILMACAGIDRIEEAYPILRHIKKREILRIGAKDLTGFAELTETTEGLTALAEATLEAAYRMADRFLKKRFGTPQVEGADGKTRECAFAILGMGKLGGEELNFSSDIDLLYLYESDQGETTGIPDASGGVQGKVENHLYFVRLCERITDLIHANTEDGFVFRVDLRLRPEGKQGPVTSSLRSYELYYESFGQTWERAAHLKCRPVAGDLALGQEMITLLRPFVYRKYLDYGAIAEIQEMKGRILRKLALGRAQGFNVKLGRGGIRSIEFLIQSLQLLFGGKTTWIRERNSLRALHRLCDKEIITYEDYAALSQAYLLLRDVEHKLQIENQLQTQTLPKNPEQLDRLARRCGLTDGKNLSEELEKHTSHVETLFEQLFRKKEEDGPDTGSLLQGIAWGIADGEEADRYLTDLGFSAPQRALKNIEVLREGPPYQHNSSRCRSAFLRVAPSLIREAGASPDPDMALNHLERFITGYQARETFYTILGDNPEALHRIISLFSISSYLSNLLIRHPGAMEVLLGGDVMESCVLKEAYVHQLMEELEHRSSDASVLDILRRFKHLEELKIGLRDILTKPDILQTAHSLSSLADACLEAAHTLALAELIQIFGTPREESGQSAEFAIIGAGKLGSEELTYGADLDLLFVYSKDGETAGPEQITNQDFFSRLAGRIVSILSTLTGEGIAYRIDLRLRPLGESGPLVQSLEGYCDYFDRHLQSWERQALTRGRFCAGGLRCGEALHSLIEETLFATAPMPDLQETVRTMRKKIEDEKSSPRRREIHFKTGAGGLIDVEFLVQYLTLRHGHELKELRFAPPLSVLETARGRGLLSEKDYEGLKESYLFLRRLEGRARIVQDRPITSLSSDPGENRALALRMGYPASGEDPGTALLRDLKETTKRTREIFERILGGGTALKPA